MSDSRRGSLLRPASHSLLSRVLTASAVIGTVAGLSLADSSAALAATGGNGYKGVFISEVQTHGAGNDDASLADGDWIELHNTTSSPVDMTDAILANGDNLTKYVIGVDSPDGTATIPAGGYQAYRVDSSADQTKADNFDLDSTGEARLYAPGAVVGTTTPSDEFDWNHSPVDSWARDFADDGGTPVDAAWKASGAATLNAENDFTVHSQDLSGIKVNEINMNGGTNGDWVELYNTGVTSVNLSGAVLSDNDTSDAYIIGTDSGDTTTIAPGGFATYQVDAAAHPGNFGLGRADSVELYPSSVTDLSNEPNNPGAAQDTTILSGAQDSESWSSAPTFTLGREPDGTGTFQATTGPTFDETNADAPTAGDDITGVVLNEVKTTGDPTNGDWVELFNTTRQTIDLSGAILSDNNDRHTIEINSGVTIPSHGFLTITTDEDTTIPYVDPSATGEFGLGDDDSIRLFQPGTTDLSTATPVDFFSWTEHALTSYGRMAGDDTAGQPADWAETDAPTFGTANDFTPPMDFTSDPDSFIQVNEIESTDNAGDPFPDDDWVELVNTSPNPVNVNGMVLSDDRDYDAFALNSTDIDEVGDACTANGVLTGTSVIPAGQFALVRVDASDIPGNFDLGDDDAIRLYEPDAIPGVSIPVDDYKWAIQPIGSYQRLDNGLGDWADGAAGTQTALEPNTGC